MQRKLMIWLVTLMYKNFVECLVSFLFSHVILLATMDAFGFTAMSLITMIIINIGTGIYRNNIGHQLGMQSVFWGILFATGVCGQNSTVAVIGGVLMVVVVIYLTIVGAATEVEVFKVQLVAVANPNYTRPWNAPAVG